MIGYCKANNAALDLLGCAANELSGHAFSHFLRGGIALWVSFTDEVLTQGEAWSDDLLLVDLQLRQIAVEVRLARLRAEKCTGGAAPGPLEQRRNRAEARRQHRLGHVGWERISQVFERIQQQNRLILGAVGEGIWARYGARPRSSTPPPSVFWGGVPST
jgi:hypothetical protein